MQYVPKNINYAVLLLLVIKLGNFTSGIHRPRISQILLPPVKIQHPLITFISGSEPGEHPQGTPLIGKSQW